MSSQEQNKKVPEVLSPSDTPSFLKDNAVAIYTILAILTRLKTKVGLEAMLEYIEHYKKLIERYNPDFREAVDEAMALLNVEKMYRDITRNENP